MKEKFDFIVIGAGAAGIAVVNQLKKHQNITIALICGNENGYINYKYIKKPHGLEIIGYKGIGGGTNVWGNVCRPLDKEDFLKHSDISFMPPKSSIIKAAKLLGVEHGIPFWFSQNKYENINIAEMNHSTKKFKRLPFAYNEPALSLKKTFKTFQHNTNIEIYKNVDCKKIIDSKDTYKLECIDDSSQVFHIEGDKIILAAGVINSPLILKNSIESKLLKIEDSASANIGKNLSDHTMGTLCQIHLKNPVNLDNLNSYRKNNSKKIKFAFSRSDNNISYNSAFYYLPSFFGGKLNQADELRQKLISIKSSPLKSLKYFLDFLKNPDVLFQAIDYFIRPKRKIKILDVWAINEQPRNSKNEIRFVFNSKLKEYEAEIYWDISEQDKDAAEELYMLIKNEIECSHKITKFNREDWSKRVSSAAHLTGTLRQSLISKDGCVDSNYKIWGSRHIYCCDASIVPVSGNSNITLNIVANAIMLANLLMEEKYEL